MLVTLRNLSKKLGSFALENISMELPEGYIMGLIGPNGAGKTSLLRIILGLYVPDEGDVRINGMAYRGREIAIRQQCGAVLLEDLFENCLSLRENGALYGRFFQNYRQEVFEGFLGRFSLEPARRYRALSRGERIKFQLAFALSHDARLLVLDEPAANFDRAFRREFFTVLKEFIADGTRSVILSTHLTDDLDRIADYILYLEDGKSIFTGDIEMLREQYCIVSGENYRVRAVPKEFLIHLEEEAHGARALVRSGFGASCGTQLSVHAPSIEELMFFMAKREGAGPAAGWNGKKEWRQDR